MSSLSPSATPHTRARTLRSTARCPPGGRAQKKFVDLGGSAENQGDLKSVVLHKMTLAAQKSTFPIALGVRITGVDDSCFSQTGGKPGTQTIPSQCVELSLCPLCKQSRTR